MNIRQLRHFVAVGETLHFGQAAKRLGMTQPPLSQSIHRLEETLGVQLLARTQRRVTITAAGQTLLKEAREILTRIELAEQLTRRASTERTELRIGFVPSALFRILPPAIARFRQRWPGVRIQVTEILTADQIEKVHRGDLDFGFVYTGHFTSRKLQVRVIENSPLCVAVSASSPLAQRRFLRLADLRDEQFVQAHPTVNPEFQAILDAACRRAGIQLNVVQYSNQAFTTLKLVASGIGITLIPAMVQALNVNGVRFKPIAPREPEVFLNVSLIWVDRTLSPMENDFVGQIEKSTEAFAHK